VAAWSIAISPASSCAKGLSIYCGERLYRHPNNGRHLVVKTPWVATRTISWLIRSLVGLSATTDNLAAVAPAAVRWHHQRIHRYANGTRPARSEGWCKSPVWVVWGTWQLKSPTQWRNMWWLFTNLTGQEGRRIAPRRQGSGHSRNSGTKWSPSQQL